MCLYIKEKDRLTLLVNTNIFTWVLECWNDGHEAIWTEARADCVDIVLGGERDAADDCLIFWRKETGNDSGIDGMVVETLYRAYGSSLGVVSFDDGSFEMDTGLGEDGVLNLEALTETGFAEVAVALALARAAAGDVVHARVLATFRALDCWVVTRELVARRGWLKDVVVWRERREREARFLNIQEEGECAEEVWIADDFNVVCKLGVQVCWVWDGGGTRNGCDSLLVNNELRGIPIWDLGVEVDVGDDEG